MKDWIKRALTKTVAYKGPRGKQEIILIQPNERLVLFVKFAIGMTFSLAALEVAHLAFLRAWSSEIFAAITGLIGTVTGVLVGKHT
jgi:hypothetical protein